MTCADIERVLVDLGRGGALAGEGLAHLVECPGCTAHVASQKRVAWVLGALADADACRSAPARVEAATVAAWRARAYERSAVAGRRGLFTWIGVPALRWGALAATVVMVLAAALSWSRSASPLAPYAPTVARVIPSAEDVTTPRIGAAGSGERTPSIADTLPAPKPVPVARARQAAQPRLSRRAAANRRVVEGANDEEDVFVLLPYAEPLRPMELRQVVRLEVPRATVAQAGLSAGGLETRDRIVADVLVGEDGIGRGIRIVR
jgi:hypothetical protein